MRTRHTYPRCLSALPGIALAVFVLGTISVAWLRMPAAQVTIADGRQTALTEPRLGGAITVTADRLVFAASPRDADAIPRIPAVGPSSVALGSLSLPGGAKSTDLKPKDKPKPPKAEEPPDDPPAPPPVPPVPGAPVVVSCTSGDMEDVITFTPGTGGPVAEFSLLRSATEGGPFSVVATAGPDATALVFSVTETGGAYYALTATGPGGTSGPSASADNGRVQMSRTVPPEGRTLRASNGEVALVIPAGAFAAPTEVCVNELSVTPVGAMISLSGVYDITPDGPLLAPATLSVRYTLGVTHFQVIAAVLEAAELMTFDEATNTWVAGAANVRAEDGYLKGELSHFCEWHASAISPHGTSATTYCSSADLCHNLSSYPGSETRIAARDSAVCYHCHGGDTSLSPARGALGPNVQAQFFACPDQSAHGSTETTHPVATGDLYCTVCHDPHADSASSPALLRSWSPVTGTYVTGGGGTGPGDAFCWTCHGVIRNRRTEYLVPGYYTRTGGDRKTGYSTSAHAQQTTESSVTCTLCHGEHGGVQNALLPARQYSACTGATGEACHSAPENAVGGSNIKAQLTSGGTNDLTHHDVEPAAQVRTGASIECTSCHNVHRNSATQPISDPDNLQVSMALTPPASVDSNGSAWLRVGAEHDGAAPVISAVSIASGPQWLSPTVSWTTNEPATSWVEWGLSTSYGNSAGDDTLRTSHSATMSGLSGGTTYHYRIRTVDALGNVRNSIDYTYVPIEPPSTPTPVTVAPDPYPGNMSTATVPLTWSAVTCPDGHPVGYRIRVTGVIGDWDYTPYNYSWTTESTGTVVVLTEGTYTWTVAAYDAGVGHTAAESYPSAGDTFAVSNAPNSCPFLFTWDGEKFAFEVDLYDAGRLGVQTPRGTLVPSPVDYYVLNSDPVPLNGELEMRVVGERWETDYLDAIGLYAVDVPADRELVAESADYGKTLGSLIESVHTVSETPQAPVSATHVGAEQDVLGALLEADGQYVHLNDDNNVFEYQTLEVDLGDFGDASQVKLLVDHAVVFPNTTAGMALRQTFGPRDKLEVIGADGEWTQVPLDLAAIPKPGEFRRTDVVDITGIFPTADHRIRMTYLFESYIDRVAVDLTDDAAVAVTALPLRSAMLGGHGIDSVTPEDVYEYVYGESNGDRAYFTGYFTRYGGVQPLLDDVDDRFVIFGGGDEIVARFEPAAEPPAAGTKRYYVLYSHGYYKGTTDGTQSTVGPLPFAGMSTYPYGSDEHFPDDAEHLGYLAEWNTRFIDPSANAISTPEAADPVVSSSRALPTSSDSLLAALGASADTLSPDPDESVAELSSGDMMYSVDTNQAVLRVVKSDGSVIQVPVTAGWESTTTNITTGPTPSTPGTAVDASVLAKTATRDVDYWRTDLTLSDNAVNWQLMRFDIPVPAWQVRAVTFVWYGHGEPTPAYELKLDVWNPVSGTWTQVRNAQTATDTEVVRSDTSTSGSAVCLRCHDGSAPAGVGMPTAGITSLANWTASTGDYHGGRSGGGTGGSLAVPYARNTEVACGTCHASHGSASNYHIPGMVNGSVVPAVTSGTNIQPLCASCHVGTLSQLHGSAGGCWCHGLTIYEHDGAYIPPVEVYLTNCLDCHGHGKSWTHTKAGNADCWNCGSDPYAHGSTPPSAVATF